jgi:alcohol dehydrogenase (NADP+)
MHMKHSNDNSRRYFLRQSAVIGAGAVLAAPSSVLAQKSAGVGNGPYPTPGMAGYSETGPLKPLKFQRRALGPKDVAIKIRFCGVCHSDIHTIHGDWGKIQYPQVVGHELAGEVLAGGSSVSKFDVGSRVGGGNDG